MDEHDVIVIGMGPGGEEVAGTLAERGLDVLGVDSNLVGGECAYWGCVPSKMMVRAAHTISEARRAQELAGSTGELTSNWSAVAARIRSEATDNWNDQVAIDRFTAKGGTFLRGRGRLVEPGVVQVNHSRHRARRAIVVATGSQPAIPPVDGLSDVDYWTNREAVEAKELPETLVVLGGGAIGSEMAQVFARFGVQVTVVEAADHLLPLQEPEAGAVVEAVFRREGVAVHTGAAARSVRPSRPGEGVEVTLASGAVVAGERLLVATGRRVDVAASGLEVLGVDPQSRFVPVDDRCRVAAGVWAVGDVTGRGPFTHVAMYQAGVSVRDILGDSGRPAEYHAVPRVIFTDPEVGAVGLTERQAREQLPHVRVSTTPIPSTARGWLHKAGNDGFIKLVEDVDRGVLVGATSVGPAGGEVLGTLALAVHARVPLDALASMIYAYPTFHRGIEDAVRQLARPPS